MTINKIALETVTALVAFVLLGLSLGCAALVRFYEDRMPQSTPLELKKAAVVCFCLFAWCLWVMYTLSRT